MEQKYVTDDQGNKVLPITHVNAVRDDDGNTVASLIGSKAPQDTTYTKTEVDAKFDEFAGPTYDPATRAIIFPATAKVSYDADTRAVVFG